MKVILLISPLQSIMDYRKINNDLTHLGHLLSRLAGINLMSYLYLDIVNMKPEDEIEVNQYNLFIIDKHYSHHGFAKAVWVPGVKEPRLSPVKEVLGSDFVNMLVMEVGEKNAIDMLRSNGFEFLITIPQNLEDEILNKGDKFIEEQDKDFMNIMKELEKRINS